MRTPPRHNTSPSTIATHNVSQLQFVQKTRVVFVEPTGHTFGHHTQYPQYYPPQPFHNETHIHHHHYRHDHFWNQQYNQQYSQQQQYVQQPSQDAYVTPTSNASWVPQDPFPFIAKSPESELESAIAELAVDTKNLGSPVQPKEKIFEEILRECEEIERRSSSGGSPVSSIYSSDEQEHDQDSQSPKAYHPYKTPEKKERKKAQNRLAATRYREKKRREKEEAMTCIEGLTERNTQLKDSVAELEREVTYFKKFMAEMGMHRN